MDIQKVLLLIKEHGTSLFRFKLYFPLRSATLRENFSRDRGIKEPFREASIEVSDFENTPSKEKISRLKKTLANIILKLWFPKKIPSLYFIYELLTLYRGRLLSCTDHDMMWHVYKYIIIDSKGR